MVALVYEEELEWEENHGYGFPTFTISVDANGEVLLNCGDEYVVTLSDSGLDKLKKAIDTAVEIKKKKYGISPVN